MSSSAGRRPNGHSARSWWCRTGAFLLLADRGEHPNLASHILGAAVRELPGLWYEAFGYQPLLAETFTDIEAFEGTCYRASGWQPLGKSKGYIATPRRLLCAERSAQEAVGT